MNEAPERLRTFCIRSPSHSTPFGNLQVDFAFRRNFIDLICNQIVNYPCKSMKACDGNYSYGGGTGFWFRHFAGMFQRRFFSHAGCQIQSHVFSLYPEDETFIGADVAFRRVIGSKSLAYIKML